LPSWQAGAGKLNELGESMRTGLGMEKPKVPEGRCARLVHGCATLSVKQRLLGFAICFALGTILSLSALSSLGGLVQRCRTRTPRCRTSHPRCRRPVCTRRWPLELTLPQRLRTSHRAATATHVASRCHSVYARRIALPERLRTSHRASLPRAA